MAFPIKKIILFMTKFSILIGSTRAYLSRNCRAITWLSNFKYPITTSCNWTPAPFARQSLALKWVLSCFFSIVFKKFALPVHQIYVARESSPETLYRRRKLGHKIAGFKTPEDLPSRCLQP